MSDTSPQAIFEPVSFSELPGWETDDHPAAFEAFLSSAAAVLAGNNAIAAGLRAACRTALELKAAGPVGAAAARCFFEGNFTPHGAGRASQAGLLTGYYEPELAGSLRQTGAFDVPVLARPADLVNLVDESQRGALSDRLTHARRTSDGTIDPYFDRQEIDEGVLDGRGLEIAYVADPVDLFFMQVQGSGLIRLQDGSGLRVGYDGKNGHPYTSLGRHLIETGLFTAEAMNLASLTQWLKADSARARPLLWRNRSYVFFRVLGSEQEIRTLGTDAIPLTPLRSLAVDTAFHELGLPVHVSAPDLGHILDGGDGFHRLMVAHDVGSAIKGPERGDVFCGSGRTAGAIAGMTKHAVRFFPLLPKRSGDGD
ncbi:MAG: MltA domain-containing protein [Alphaproteobacteria bacterium]|nr:MltA domain-containing protein [Alphaproteobacteria bacterium]